MSAPFAEWVGRQESVTDVLDPGRSNALLATLGQPAVGAVGAPLPPLHHWLYFWDVRPPAGLGIDGHPTRGGFLPPVPLPRRMWAGGRLRFAAPLRLGEPATRVSTILKVEAKSGRSGDLVFVTVRHELSGGAGLAISEEQDLVYRGAAAPGSIRLPEGAAEPAGAVWRGDVAANPVLLFRYSALTMNGHRIHYDRAYATGEEGYPALVVQGPLQATLLVALAARELPRPLTEFTFRGESPAFDGLPLHVCGAPDANGGRLWTEQGGTRTMTATVRTA